MRIIILSDLNWPQHLRSINEREILGFTLDDLSKSRYAKLSRYVDIILNENADLVLFAGDLTGDGSCGHGFHGAFNLLLLILEVNGIPSLFISGNHDEPLLYQECIKFAKHLNLTQDINNRSVSIKGLQILGISYDTIKSKRSLKELIATSNENYDIVLAHSQLKRRIRLFDIKSDYIFTGHYDRKMLLHRNTVFVSLDNDSDQISYALIEKTEQKSDNIILKIQLQDLTVFSLNESVNQLKKGNRTDHLLINNKTKQRLDQIESASEDSLISDQNDFVFMKYLRGQAYQKCLDSMYKLKMKEKLGDTDFALKDIYKCQITASYKVSESLIEDYLGRIDL